MWNEKESSYLKNNFHLTDGELAKTLNRTPTAIMKKRIRLGFKREQKRRWTKEEDNTLKTCWRLIPQSEISKKLGKSSRQAVHQRARRLGLEPHTYNDRTRLCSQGFYSPKVNLTEIQKQILIGSLLGDGHLEKPRFNCRFSESHSIKQKDYLLWKLNNLPFSFTTGEIVCSNQTKREYPMIWAKSKCYNSLNKFYGLTIEEKLGEINELGFLIWVLDDGSYSYSGEYLTLSLADDKIKIVQKWAKERFGISFKQTIPNANYIFLSRAETRTILPMLIQTFKFYKLPQSMGYKLGLSNEKRQKSVERIKRYRFKNREKLRKYHKEYYHNVRVEKRNAGQKNVVR